MRAGSPTAEVLEPYRVLMQTVDGTQIFPLETPGVGENTVYSVIMASNSFNDGTDGFTKLKEKFMDRLIDLMDYVVEEAPLETEIRICVAKPIEGRLPTREEANFPANQEVLYTGSISGLEVHLTKDFFKHFVLNSRIVVLPSDPQ